MKLDARLDEALDRLRRIENGERPRKVHDMVNEGRFIYKPREVASAVAADHEMVATAYLHDHDQTRLTAEILDFNNFHCFTIMCDRGNIPYYEGRGLRLRLVGSMFFLYSTSHDAIGTVETVGDLRRLLSVFKRDREILIPTKEESANA